MAVNWKILLPGIRDEAYFATYAAQIAEDVEVPVTRVGGLKSFEVIEKLLTDTKIDYFSLARPLLTEPNLVLRWQQGSRCKAKCLSCNQCRDSGGNICILHRQG